MANEQKEWLARKEVVGVLESVGCSISLRTLANMAANNNSGRGPSFYRTGWRIVRYKRSDVLAWANSRMTRIE